jgi:hypothetical protein
VVVYGHIGFIRNAARGAGEANREARTREKNASANHQTAHVATACAERHPNPELGRALVTE